METPPATLKTASRWRVAVRWLGVVVVLTLFAGAMVPMTLKARKRSRSTSILEEMRLIDGAKDQYAIENNLSGSAENTWSQIKLYLKVGTRLYGQSSNLDALGNAITLGSIDTPPVVPSRTSFTDVIDDPAVFWGSFAN